MPRERLLKTAAKSISKEAGRDISEQDIHTALGLAEGETKVKATDAEILEKLGAVKPKRSRSRNKPASTKPSPGDAAAALVKYFDQFDVDLSQPFPADHRVDRYGNHWGTTYDGVELKTTKVEWIDDRRRGGYGMDFFSPNAQLEIVTLAADLQGAPDEKTKVGPYDERLFMNRTHWWWYMYELSLRVCFRDANPPGLVLEDFTDRAGLRPFRWRDMPPSFIFVDKAFDAFIVDTAEGDLRGAELIKFETKWVDEFVAGERTFVDSGGYKKSIEDFKLGPDKFRELWQQRTHKQKPRSTPRKRTSARRRSRKEES